MALIAQGISTLHDVLAATKDRLVQLLRNDRRAQALIDAVSSAMGHGPNHLAVTHSRVAKELGIEPHVEACNRELGVKYEKAIADLLRVEGSWIVTTSDDGIRQNLPDFLIELGEQKILLECKTCTKLPPLIKKEEAWTVMQKSSDFDNKLRWRAVFRGGGNLAFAENVIDQLTGDSNLIAVRSRASRERPFTVVKKMQADAEASYRSKIKELEESLADSQRKIGQLQSGKQEGQRFILSPQQQEELANFQKKEAEAKTQLKEVRKKLRADIDSLETRIKWLDIAGMPALVALTGLVFAIVRRRRSAAR
jgi:hypothetical protein